MIASVPSLSRHGHRGRREVLHLFQMEVEALGDDCQFGHVLLRASRMTADEVRDNLLAEVQFVVYLVEYLLEVVELGERRLSHDMKHRIAGVLGSHLKASAHMLGNEFTGVFLGSLVDDWVLAFVKQQVVAHTTADETLLDTWKGIDCMIDIEQRTVVGVQVRAYLGIDTRRTLALAALVLVGTPHGIHIGTRSAEVGEIAFEIGHLGDGLDFLQDAFLASAHDELALMRTDGTEGTSAETASMQVHGELDHIEGRDALALVLRVRQTGIRKVERHVEFALCHRRVRRVYHHGAVACVLQDACRLVLVGFFLDEAEVLGLLLLVAGTSLVRMEHDVFLLADARRNGLLALHHIHGLRDIGWDERTFLHPLAKFGNRLFAHAIDQEVGTGFYEDTLADGVLPIVVMGESAERGFDTSKHHGHIRPKLLQDLGIDDGRILGTHIVTSVGRIGIFAAEALVGGILVHHGVHASGRNAEEQTGLAQLLEIAEVVPPIRLGNNGHLQALGFEQTSDHSRSERGMVHVRIATEQDDIEFIPSAEFHFLLGGGEPVGESVFFHNWVFSICHSERSET